MASSTHKRPGAMLYALTSPPPDVPLSAFNAWYDTEHSPGRARCPAFLHTARFVEKDEASPAFLEMPMNGPKSPPWLAIYELEDLSALESEAYRSLWNSTAEDERRFLGALDRRVYKLISEKMSENYEEYLASGESRVLTHIGLQPRGDLSEEEFHRWYEGDHVPSLSRCPQWLRSTRWELVDVKGVAGMEISEDVRRRIPRFLALHEWTDDEAYETSEMRKAVSTEGRREVMGGIDKGAEERRTFRLWKQFS